MRQFDLKALLPHLIAVAVFLLVSAIYCKPALESNVVLKQEDVTSWKGMSQQAFEYKEKYGHFPLWITNMFSGMPAFQVAADTKWTPLSVVNQAFQLWLPQPMNFFFLACICFYFLCLCLRIRPFPAVLGALAFAYCSYSSIIISAGHNTKMLALAYSPAVIGSAILLFERKYLTGFTWLTVFTSLQIAQMHQQISYYLFLILCFLSVSYAIMLILQKNFLHLGKALALMIAAGLLSIGTNAINIFPAIDYSKESKRGGQLVMDQGNRSHENIENGKTTGLSKDYAFQWSYGRMETWSLLFPGVQGYGMHYASRDGDQYIFPRLDEKSNTAAYLEEELSVPGDQAANIALQNSTYLYWGDQPFTSGPVYLGAIICMLFIFGLFFLDNKNKWWILGASLFGMLLALGSHFAAFNYFMFDHFPFYNKFRVPTMALVIPQLLFPIMAALVLDRISFSPASDDSKRLNSALTATAVVIALGIATYLASDFSHEDRARTAAFNTIIRENGPEMNNRLATLNSQGQPLIDNKIYENMVGQLQGDQENLRHAREFLGALRDDRRAAFRNDMIRSIVFMVLAALLIALYIRRKIAAKWMVAGVTVLSSFDLISFGSKYLEEHSYTEKENIESSEFPLTQADIAIQQDPDPNFRIYNTLKGLDECRTSYYHKSIGGYHPAKLGIYDDLLAYQLGRGNMSVINMLNTKYFIQDQGGQPVVARNPGALGNAWFVKGIRWVKGPVEEMRGLDSFNPADTAVVDEKFRAEAGQYGVADSADQIKQIRFNNDTIIYQTNTRQPRIAIFSEIYYKDWKAYIDGKPASYFKANYVLRGMRIPEGNHTVTFMFEPSLFLMCRDITYYFSWIAFLILLGYAIIIIRKKPA